MVASSLGGCPKTAAGFREGFGDGRGVFAFIGESDRHETLVFVFRGGWRGSLA